MLSERFLKYMEDWREGRAPFYNCAEIILKCVDDEYSLNLATDVIRASSGFGGGMGYGSTCGYLAGAVMALSLLFSPHEPPFGTMDLAAITGIYVENFKKFEDSIECVDLISENPPCMDLGVKSLDLLENVILQNLS